MRQLNQVEITQEEMELLMIFRSLSKDKQKMLHDFIKILRSLPDNYDESKVTFFLPRKLRRAIKIYRAVNHR